MYRFFQRNQKKMLAVFGAFLMVVFVLPYTAFDGGSGRANPVVAYLGDEKIYMAEMGHARADWGLLKSVSMRMQFRYMPWVYAELGPVAQEIDKSPDLFLLLQKEARRQGIRVSPERVEALLRSELEPPPSAPPEERERRRRAGEGFLLVQGLYDRVGANVKVSEPMVDHFLATVAQDVKLNLVEFRADEFQAAATAPTTQEVQEHFRRYANVAPGQSAVATTGPAPLPFGYQYPDRVKLQYVAVRREPVREAIKRTRNDYEWEVAAQRYYLTHQKDYQVTEPGSSPLGPALPRIAAPATRPFAEVKDQVLEKVMQPEVDRLMADIRAAIARQLQAGWDRHRASSATRPTSGPAGGPASAAATAPAESQPTGYLSFAFLEQLAADIQNQFGVLPAVTSKADQWLTINDLGALPGIGGAFTAGDDGRSFANYVLQSAEPFLPLPEKADPASVLSVGEPSEPLNGVDQNLYFFRLTDAQRAHAPKDLAEVRDKVVADVAASRAYARAVEEAGKLLDAARKSAFAAAVDPTGRRVITTGSFGRSLGTTTVPSYPLETAGRREFVEQAFKLLGEATPQKPNPVGLIEVPSERKVIVAELAGVTSQLRPTDSFAERLYVSRSLAMRDAQELVGAWFRADAVKERLGYRLANPEDEEKSQDKSEQASLD